MISGDCRSLNELDTCLRCFWKGVGRRGNGDEWEEEEVNGEGGKVKGKGRCKGERRKGERGKGERRKGGEALPPWLILKVEVVGR